jgi:hypothetical protein
MSIRINGLIRVFNHVRSQLQIGLTPDEVEPFKQQVQALLRDVEALCRRNGVGPEQLPAPSRRAYVFLRELELDNLPLRQSGEPAAVQSAFRIKNVVKIGEQFAALIWRRLDALLTSSEVGAQLVRDIEGQIVTIEQLCARHGQTPAALEAPSRLVYGWLKFLTSTDQLPAHLAALQAGREVARQLPLTRSRPLHLHLLNLNALWRKREYQDALLLKVQQGFQNADRQVWQALLQDALVQRTAASEQLYRDFANSEDFNEVLFELESFAAPPAPPARGRAHDLHESFARVNAAYFGNQMRQPRLVWNRTLTARKFGHYQPSRETIMISVTLDDPGVPAYVLDFVMYHELLHKKHGSTTVNGRRLAHSPDFRAEERQFTEYHAAERQLKELALRQRGMGGLSFDGGDE